MTTHLPTTYGVVAKLLHWVMAIGLVSLFTLGLYMVSLPFSPDKLKLYSWHKWAGITLLALVLVRSLWRLTHRPPAMLTTIPGWQQTAAHLGHAALYVLMFAIPVTGWLMSSAKGVPTVLFGVWPLPDLVSPNTELGNTLQALHWYLNLSLAGLVVLHIAAALKHHWVERDNTLTRMLPFCSPGTRT